MKKPKIGTVIVIIILCNLIYLFINQQRTMKQKEQQLKAYEQQLKEVKQLKQKLSDELKISETTKYEEKLVRERLGLIKQEEITVVDKKK